MKNIVLSAVATAAISSFAIAGGDVVPVVPIVEPVEGNFYVGAAYSAVDVRQTEAPSINPTVNDNFTAVMLQAGYKFNEYIAVEGRVSLGLEESVVSNYATHEDSSVDVWAIYAKPMYPVTDLLDVYALLGYASTSYDIPTVSIDDDSGFAYGIGLQYAITDNIATFIDYVNLYEKNKTPNDDFVYSYSVGVNYTF